MKRIIPALFLLFLFVSVPASATIWMSTGGGGYDIITTDCSTFVTDGFSCWDSDDNIAYTGDGVTAQAIGPGTPGAGDIAGVGNCASGTAFAGACGTILSSNTDIIIDLDDDQATVPGAESFQIRDGADAVIFEVTEAGVVTSTTFAGALTGNADTATALAANPADCGANEFAQSIDAAGVLTCAAIADADVPDTITISLAATATALAANGANCAAGQSPLGVDASGAVEGCIDLPNTYQPLDAELTTLAGLTETNGAVIFAAGGAWTADLTPALDCSDCTLPAHATDHAVGGTDTVFPADPNADAIMVWDDAPTGAIEFAMIGTGLSFDGTTLTATATATKWNAIVNADGNGDIAFGETVQTMDWNTTATPASFDALTISLTHDGSEAGTQRLLVVSRPNSVGTATVDTLVRIAQLDTDSTVTRGLHIVSAGTMDVGIDLSDGTGITTAIALGSNPITTTSSTIAAAELDLLDTMTARTGADLSFVTGTAGLTDECAKWNVDGDLISTGAACGGNTLFSDIGLPTAATAITFDDTETVTFDSASDGEVFFTISLNAADLLTDTTALLITAVDNDDVNYIPFLIQDDQDVTPDDLFKVDSAGNVTALGTMTTGGFTLVTADAGANAFYGWDDVAGQYENLSAAEALTIVGGAANDFDANGDVTITVADVSDIAANYQPLDADLTTIAGLTATSGNVMFAAASAWTSDATPAIDCTDCTANLEAADNSTTQIATTSFVQQEINGAGGTNLTCSGGQCNVDAVFLPLAGGTLTAEVVVDDLGLEFTAGDTLTDCSTFAATGGGIFYDDSEGIFKKCQDNVLSDLDAAGAFSALTAPTAATSLTFQDTETITFTSEETTGPFFTINLTGTTTAETTALLIQSAANNDPNYQPLLIQDNSAGTPEDLLSLNYQGNLTIAGSLSTPDTDNGKVTFTPATVGESLWVMGPNHDGLATDDDSFEFRQSATPGTSVRASLSTAGILSVNGLLDLADDGMTILSTSSTITVESVVFTGGALGGVDSIDATGAVDMDYGSADVTDHTFTSDGGTVILDGVITADGLTLGANENITLGAETLDHDGTAFVFSDSVTVGVGGAGVDYTLTFDGETNNGVITYMEDENEFRIPHPIVAPNSWGSDITGAVTLGDQPHEMHGRYYYFTAAATATLAASATSLYGSTACFMVRDAAEAAIIDVQAGERINLDGTALAAGTGITATGAGAKVCMVATTDADGAGVDGYIAWGNTSEWASQ